MTLGEKITHLRVAQGMTQEQMAERLAVSRQSVSKWEMDQAQPQIGKILMLCELFHIPADTLLRDQIPVDGARVKNKYFGTDGFRGEANAELTSMHA
ncbi:MAG: helix-turn-helix domain-containing protein, partial [Clostridia bacterium]|nr:helix-turn-helix domain-containing protein [Clostridia bacterium]